MLQKRTGKHRRQDLRCHREGIVHPGEFTDITALAHLDDHRIRIDIDGRPSDTDQQENDVDAKVRRLKQKSSEEAGREQQYTE